MDLVLFVNRKQKKMDNDNYPSSKIMLDKNYSCLKNALSKIRIYETPIVIAESARLKTGLKKMNG